MVLNMLLPFCTMYLCEVIFSALTIMKSKYYTSQKDLEDVVSYKIKPSAEA